MSVVTKVTLKKRRDFLKRLARHGNVAAAALASGINRRSWYRHKEKDRDFAAAWEDAVQQATDMMILEARRRAMDGTKKPVFYKGAVCGHFREYSDTLLMFLIKAHRPEYATERREVSGKDGAPINPPALIVNFVDAEDGGPKERELISRIATEILLAEADEADRNEEAKGRSASP